MAVEPVIGHSATRLVLAPSLRGRLRSLAVGRPLVIDYYAFRLRGVPVGDLIVRFGHPAQEPCYVELEPLEDVTILAERRVVRLLEGATVGEAGPPWHRHLALGLARPEDWIDFLDRHPSRRR